MSKRARTFKYIVLREVFTFKGFPQKCNIIIFAHLKVKPCTVYINIAIIYWALTFYTDIAFWLWSFGAHSTFICISMYLYFICILSVFVVVFASVFVWFKALKLAFELWRAFYFPSFCAFNTSSTSAQVVKLSKPEKIHQKWYYQIL